jgi:hypothetical protein
MKRMETTPGGSARECVMLERITYEDRPTKRRGIESRVSNGDTNSSSGRRGPKEEVQTPWSLRSAATSEEDEEHK